MIYKLNNKGIGLPTVLGIVTFVIAVAATLLIVAVSQAQLVDKSFERTEAYANAVQAVDATAKIIARDQNLDRTYLDELQDEMGVTIEPYSLTSSVYVITSMVTTTRIITSYLTGSASATDTYDKLFKNTGQEEGFDLAELMITPASLLSAYLPEFFENNFDWLTLETNFSRIRDFVEYIKELAKDGDGFIEVNAKQLEEAWDPTAWWHWYIDDDVEIPKNKNLTIPEGFLLVIDGNLKMNSNSTLTGNVIVNGTFQVATEKKAQQYVYGTVYARSTVTLANNTYLGIISRPSFIFTEGNITLNKSTTGYGYFMSRNFTSKQTTTYFTGGVYTTGTLNLKVPVTPNPSLSLYTNQFYNYAIPSTIPAPDDGSGSSTTFIYTSPTLN